jgi:lysozyme family protein
VGEIDDGIVGNRTLRAISDFNGNIVEEFIKRRKLFYVTLAQKKPELRVFLKGWLNRVDHTKFE